ILENQKVMKEYFEAVLNNNSEVVETAKDCLDRLDELDNSPLADIYAKIIHYTQVLMCNYDLSRPEFLEDAGEKIKKT
ncbi:MAG: hypothetical protein KKG59_06560, partial [Nanoarchaeota archaeon]|nr:hypothetical protein [Nanoarchaeota archaeon]